MRPVNSIKTCISKFRSAPTRVLFFSHDFRGLGHLRRTLLLWEGIISRFLNTVALLVTGSQMAHAFRLPKSLDYIKLPTIRKMIDGGYESPSLDVPYPDLLKLRAQLLLEIVRHYKPDVIFIDTPPLSTHGEVMESLKFVRENLPNTKIILNLRDILDDSKIVIPLWRSQNIFAILEEFYDRICVYGDERIYNLPIEYEFPDSIMQKTVLCGYIPRIADHAIAQSLRQQLCSENDRLILITVGGGIDSAVVIDTYLRALPLINSSIKSVILAGPELSIEEYQHFRHTTKCAPDIVFIDFVQDVLAYMQAADLIVSMAGYNTINEVAALGKPAIVIPRIGHSFEQQVRARRFSQQGMVYLLEPGAMTPALLAQSIDNNLSSRAIKSQLQCTAFEKLATVLSDLLPSQIIADPHDQ